MKGKVIGDEGDEGEEGSSNVIKIGNIQYNDKGKWHKKLKI